MVDFSPPPRQGPWLTFSNPYALVDDSAAPIYYLLSRSPGQTSEETLQNDIEWAIEWWKQLDHPVAWLTDMRQYGTATAKRRSQYADFLNAIAPYQEEYLVASATLVSRKEHEGVITAISWMSTIKANVYQGTEISDAIMWLRTQLEEHGVDPGPLRIPMIKIPIPNTAS